MGVGVRMKAVLRDRKMTIKELAAKAEVPINTLYSITKRDSDQIDEAILQRIASVLNMPPDYFCGEIKPKQKVFLRYALFYVKVFELARKNNISYEDLCIRIGLPFDEWYRWYDHTSTSYVDHIPQIADVFDVPKRTFQKYLDGKCSEGDDEDELLDAFHQLNSWGKEVALERIHELCKIEDYTK